MFKKIGHAFVIIWAVLTALIVFGYSYFRYCFAEDVSLFWIKHRTAICEGAIAAVTLILLCMAIFIIDIGYILLPCLMILALIHNIDGLKGCNKKVFLLSYVVLFIVLTIFTMNYLIWYFPFITFLCSFPYYLILKSL